MSWWGDFLNSMGHWLLHDSASQSGVSLTHAPNPPPASTDSKPAAQLPDKEAEPAKPAPQPTPPKALPATGQSTVPVQINDTLGGVSKIASSIGSLGSLIDTGLKAYKKLGSNPKKDIIKTDSDKSESDDSEQSDDSQDSESTDSTDTGDIETVDEAVD
jgi:hypothetical protein